MVATIQHHYGDVQEYYHCPDDQNCLGMDYGGDKDEGASYINTGSLVEFRGDFREDDVGAIDSPADGDKGQEKEDEEGRGGEEGGADGQADQGHG